MLLTAGFAAAQTAPKTAPTAPVETEAQRQQEMKQKLQEIAQQNLLVGKQEREGVLVRLDALCHFRGTWTQQLVGVGLVSGLDRTGDSQTYTLTQQAMLNFLRKNQMSIDPNPSNSIPKNLALVSVTAELPPYSTPGQRIDLTVSALGDASSLRNGTLLNTELKYPGIDKVFAVAAGPISVEGYSSSAGGNKSVRGFVTVGKVRGGAIVQEAVPTSTVFDGQLYLDLEQEDITTAERIEEKITQTYPEFLPHAMGAGTISVTIPKDRTVAWVQSKLLQLTVLANTEAKVIIDERSGTIVIGGNVRLAPCAIARGSISVQVTEDVSVSQPAPLSGGSTAAVSSKTLSTTEETAQVTLLRSNATVADLAEIFQALKLKAEDIIAILENLHAQGALKAKLEVQ